MNESQDNLSISYPKFSVDPCMYMCFPCIFAFVMCEKCCHASFIGCCEIIFCCSHSNKELQTINTKEEMNI